MIQFESDHSLDLWFLQPEEMKDFTDSQEKEKREISEKYIILVLTEMHFHFLYNIGLKMDPVWIKEHRHDTVSHNKLQF